MAARSWEAGLEGRQSAADELICIWAPELRNGGPSKLSINRERCLGPLLRINLPVVSSFLLAFK